MNSFFLSTAKALVSLIAVFIVSIGCGGGSSAGPAVVEFNFMGRGRAPKVIDRGRDANLVLVITGVKRKDATVYEQTQVVPIEGDTVEARATVPTGPAVVKVTLENATLDGHSDWNGLADLKTGPNTVDLAPGDGDWEDGPTDAIKQNEASVKLRFVLDSKEPGQPFPELISKDFEWIKLMGASAATQEMFLQCINQGSTINFYDDVKLYTDSQLLLEEGFDTYADGTTDIPTMNPHWSGTDGFVTKFHTSPESSPNCWANLAYRTWARQDGITVDNSVLPPSKIITFEASVFLTDLHKGGLGFGLSQPFGGVFQCEIAWIVFRDGFVYNVDGVHSSTEPASTGFATYVPMRWYRVKAVCNFATNKMDVYLRDQTSGEAYKLVGPNVQMNSNTEFGNQFTHFGLGMVGFW